VEIFTYNLFVTFLTSKDISRIITTRSLIDIEQNMLCNKGTWNNVFVQLIITLFSKTMLQRLQSESVQINTSLNGQMK
jgi:hypothetical protein